MKTDTQQIHGIMKRHFDRELEDLKIRILRMGGTVEDLIVRSIDALLTRDRNLTDEALLIEEQIDRDEVLIEEECLKLIALYQPVATDLRFITSVLKINSDLERMGDLAVHIAERAEELASHPSLRLPNDLRKMASEVQGMVHSSLESLVNQDSEAALRVLEVDDVVDRHHSTMFEFVSSEIRNHPDQASALLQLLSASRYLERIADGATNIAEDVYYLVEGQIIRHRHTAKH